MKRQYEVTFIIDPVLSDSEIKSTAQTYIDLLKENGCTIVYVDEMGLRQLAYPIKKRNSGIYFCVEFQTEPGEVISKMELALRRDERIMRFLTVVLDKYGVKFNADKRAGLIGKKRKAKVAEPVAVAEKPKSAPATPVAKAAEVTTSGSEEE